MTPNCPTPLNPTEQRGERTIQAIHDLADKLTTLPAEAIVAAIEKNTKVLKTIAEQTRPFTFRSLFKRS